ncbi:hypothetical protein QEH54_22820, partial [Pelagicoccus sp. SDUM812003]
HVGRKKMKPPSRTMEPSKSYSTIGYTPLLIVELSILAAIYFLSSSFLLTATIFGFFALVQVIGLKWEKTKKEERKEDSICSFSKALPAKDHDTWVVRAVYEELTRDCRFPIQPTDRLFEDLRFDDDDLDVIAEEVARRSRRTLDQKEKNPRYKKVFTVSDMIDFFENQPKETNQPNQAAHTTPASAPR